MQITLPKKPKVIESKDNKAVIEIENCYPGYGLTLGNSFRRVLLSSLPGAAIVAVKIKGVKHEFSTIDHVLEDVIQIILNLKLVRFKLISGKAAKATLKVKGERKVTAADIKTSAELKVINTDAYIATITSKKGEIEMELDIEKGLGYVASEQRKKEKVEIGKIAIDASFTPIKRVYYSIDSMRVGDRTDFNRLRINLETDGSLTPEDAFQKAAQILVDHYQLFTKLEDKSKKKRSTANKQNNKAKKLKQKNNKTSKPKGKEDAIKVKVENLKLSTRVTNALTEAGYKTVAGLIKKSEDTLSKIEGMGPKGVKEVKRALSKLGLTLKQTNEA